MTMPIAALLLSGLLAGWALYEGKPLLTLASWIIGIGAALAVA